MSNMQYFLLNIPVILLTLILYRMVYHVFSNYRVMLFFKKFTYWGVLILLLLEGNIEFFFFSFIGDFSVFFSSNYNHKLFNSSTFIISFLVLFASTFGLFSLYLVYRKKSSQFYDNCSGKCSSAFYYLVVNGVFNITRGLFHRIAINSPDIQVVLLFLL